VTVHQILSMGDPRLLCMALPVPAGRRFLTKGFSPTLPGWWS